MIRISAGITGRPVCRQGYGVPEPTLPVLRPATSPGKKPALQQKGNILTFYKGRNPIDPVKITRLREYFKPGAL